MPFLASILFAAATSAQPVKTVQARGAGNLTCATAFTPEYYTMTENWIAGFWAAWDMSQINRSPPLASGSDLNGIVGEVQKICRDKPSLALLLATLEARSAVKTRERGAAGL